MESKIIKCSGCGKDVPKPKDYVEGKQYSCLYCAEKIVYQRYKNGEINKRIWDIFKKSMKVNRKLLKQLKGE